METFDPVTHRKAERFWGPSKTTLLIPDTEGKMRYS